MAASPAALTPEAIVHDTENEATTNSPAASTARASRRRRSRLDVVVGIDATLRLRPPPSRLPLPGDLHQAFHNAFHALLLRFFAVAAVSLAAPGIFGVMSYSVAQRSREIGVRLALGAHAGAVRAMILRQAMVLALAVVAALLSGVAFVASFLPAHQATRVDPLVTLRSE